MIRSRSASQGLAARLRDDAGEGRADRHREPGGGRLARVSRQDHRVDHAERVGTDYLDAGVIYEQLIRGEIDFGIVAVPHKDSNIVIYPFESEPLVFVCSWQHSLAKKLRLDIQKYLIAVQPHSLSCLKVISEG